MFFNIFRRGRALHTHQSTPKPFFGLRLAKPTHLAVAAALFVSGPADASTITVNFEAEVTEFLFSNPDFEAAAPFAIGDTFSVTGAFVQTPASSTQRNSVLRHNETAISLTGSVGAYTFSENLGNPGPLQANYTQVRGQEYPNFAGDLLQSVHAVQGDSVAQWELSQFAFVVFDNSGNFLTDDSFGPELFDQSRAEALVSEPFALAELSLIFSTTEPGFGAVRVIADLRNQPTIAPVPLPASVWVLLVGLVPLIRLGRARSQTSMS